MAPARESASENPSLASLIKTAHHCAVVDGWRLVPMEAGEKKPNQVILPGRRWSKLRTAPTSYEDIERWVHLDPSLGLAVITGPCSGHLVCVDVDHPEKWPSTLPIPPSPQVETPRGFRSFYEASRPLRTRKFEWGEILYGGLAILPPSLHPSGERYRWSGYLAPWETPIERLPEAYYPLCEIVEPPKQIAMPRPRAKTLKAASLLDRDSLRDYYSDPATVHKIAKYLGIPNFVPGRAFPCILPGHHECSPSASIYQGGHGVFVYHDWHMRDGIEFITLPEVRASFAYGRMTTLRNARPEAATWGIRLLVESGVIDPVPVDPILLPPDAPLSARKIAKGFQELLSCRWLYTPGDPAPFSRRFASAWCNMGEVQAGEGLKYLRDRGMLKIVDRCRSMPLYEVRKAA